MHRISVKQNRLLNELSEQAKRIEELSREEHGLIKEVHPQVRDMKSEVDEVVDAVRNRSDIGNANS
jgi:hypothetical protein